MTTPESLGKGPQEPASPYAQHQPSTPSYAGSTATMPSQPPTHNKPMGLALAALIVGIVAFLSGLVPVFGALVGITAIVLGVIALRKKQPKGMALTGVILGAIATLVSIVMTFGIGAAVNSVSDSQPSEVIEQSASAAPQEPDTAAPVEAAEPTEEAAPAPEAPAAPAVPVDYLSALAKATSYSEMMHMSKAGLFGQLTSEYGEQFSPEAGQYAVDNVQADWNANALAKAKDYQEQMAMSPEAIRDQLTSEYGEQFTQEEADYAILHIND
jgi:hypothetical protein